MAAAAQHAAPAIQPALQPQFSTVEQFSAKFPAWSVASLRWLIFCEHKNGLRDSGAIVRIGRRVRIDEQAFFAWVRDQQRHGAA